MNDLTKPSQIIVKTLAGCEELLMNELCELGCSNVQKLTRAVKLEGDWSTVFLINYCSRFSLNVLINISNFTVNDYEDIYKGAKEIYWAHYLTSDDSFLIKQSVTSNAFPHTQLCALRLKDAIADYFKTKTGQRPSVNKDHPDFIFHIHIHNDKAQVLIDTTGLSLYRRGYKVYHGIAPLNEILAAAMVKWSGWDPSKKLIDFFAGSGTILCEAYLQAINRPAGFYRNNYAFMKFRNFNNEDWHKFRNNQNKKEYIPPGMQIEGFEINTKSIEGAIRNFNVIEAQNCIKLTHANALEVYHANENDYIISNPPYGKRIEPMDNEFIKQLSVFFKHNCPGVHANLILPVELANAFGFKQKYKRKVMNGELDCQVFGFDVFAGKKSTHKSLS